MILAWTRLQQGARAFVPREQGALLAQRVLHAEAIIASYDLSVILTRALVGHLCLAYMSCVPFCIRDNSGVCINVSQ